VSVGVNEQLVTKVLLSLWQRPETTIAELMRQFGVGVQDVLEVLSERRCLIERTPAGVRLVATGLSCWRDVVEDHAVQTASRFGRRAIILARTASTNDIAWQHAESADADGIVVVADEQTAGRGRFGNSWCAKPEQSILLSLLIRMDSSAGIDTLTLLAGLATARAVERMGVARAAIKWPNDILVEGRKLAGILVERRGGHVVIGIGVNIAQTAADFPPDVTARATSLYQATSAMVDRLRVLMALLEELEKALAAPQQSVQWIGEWKSRCEMLGTRVKLQESGTILTGLVLDVDPLNGLVLRDDRGATHFLSAQTTTLSI